MKEKGNGAVRMSRSRRKKKRFENLTPDASFNARAQHTREIFPGNTAHFIHSSSMMIS